MEQGQIHERRLRRHVERRVFSIGELHQELAEAPLAAGLPVTSPIRARWRRLGRQRKEIAVEAPAWKSPDAPRACIS